MPRSRIPLCTLLILAAGFAAARAGAWYTERPYADSTAGDWSEGEDPRVRSAAVDALGKLNGAIVVTDADTGRVLTIVNQKLALSDGYIPCSTIKLVAALGALSEGLIEPEEKVWFPGGWFMTVVEGLAISNNVLFDHLGETLGFRRFERYARFFGFGERAGWSIPGEQLGQFPQEEHRAGVGRMSSFGDGISVTPLQLAAFTGAIANGGKLYYLQHPASRAEAAAFEPKLKRELPIASWVTDIRQGMLEAVRRGTAKTLRVSSQPVWGKTGTCSLYLRKSRTRLGWFTSYTRTPDGRTLSVVVMLRGGASIYGPLAAEVAGKLYRGMNRRQIVANDAQPTEVCACE